MNVRTWSIALAILVLALAILACGSSPTAIPTAPQASGSGNPVAEPATLEPRADEVWHAVQNNTEQRVVQPESASVGDRVRTDTVGKALLRWPALVLLLYYDTQMHIDDCGGANTCLGLAMGTAASGGVYAADRHVRYTTDLASVELIGTTVMVNHDPSVPRTIIRVFDGVVLVSSLTANAQQVATANAGQWVVVEKDQPPRVSSNFDEVRALARATDLWDTFHEVELDVQKGLGPNPLPASQISIEFVEQAPTAQPVIVGFTVEPASIVLGRAPTVHLSWNTEGADSVSIEPGIGTFGPSESTDIAAPSSDTTYTLVASNTAGQTERTVTLRVEPRMCRTTTAANFRAGPGTAYEKLGRALAAGTQFEPLAYVAAGNPASDGSWVQGNSGSQVGWVASKFLDCNLPVDGLATGTAPALPPTIRNFRADPAVIGPDRCTDLRWDAVTNVEQLSIEPGVGNVAISQRQQTICPSGTTEYVMVASGPGGATRASTDVTVLGEPTIDYFYADPPGITAGGCSILRWGATQNATGVYIDQGIGGVGTPDQREVCPTTDTTYVMTLEGPGGPATRSAPVAVGLPAGPTISGFGPDSLEITRGACTPLRWGTTQNTTAVYIEPGIGGVAAPGATDVCPTQTTTYAMTLVGPGGKATISAVVTVKVAPVPNPVLVLDGSHKYTASGGTYVSYDLTVTNWAQYSAELFQAAPDLPPCGSNTNASRTWVEIRNGGNDAYIYGFCAMSSPEQLTTIWFGVGQNETPPQTVYVVLKDRRNNISYRSNTVTIWTPRPIG